jgi:hypothetical protein
MSFTILLQKLLVLETSIGTEPNSILRHRVQDAQNYLLQMQKERADGLGSHNRNGARESASSAA